MPVDDVELDRNLQRMCDLVRGVATLLVDSPDHITVEHETGSDLSQITLFVAADDLEKVLGKQGRTARSLRTLLTAASSRLPHRLSLDIVEIDQTA